MKDLDITYETTFMVPGSQEHAYAVYNVLNNTMTITFPYHQKVEKINLEVLKFQETFTGNWPSILKATEALREAGVSMSDFQLVKGKPPRKFSLKGCRDAILFGCLILMDLWSVRRKK
jgi:hypothetical protein